MRLITIDRKKGILRIIPETKDDLWVIDKIVDRGDVVSGRVVRREKREGERGKGELKKVNVKISVDKTEFHEFSGSLRIIGKVIESWPEEIGRGKYQTLEVEIGKELVLHKEITDSVVNMLREAEEESKRPEVTLVSLDDERAVVYTLSQRLERKGIVRNTSKSRSKEGSLKEYFGKVLSFIESLEPELVIVGGPGIICDEFIEFSKESRKKIRGVRTSMGGEKGIYEIVASRAERLVEEHRLEKILSIIEEFNKRLAKGEPVAVGEEIKRSLPAVEALLIHEDYFLKNREEAKKMMDSVLRARGKVYLVPKDFVPGKVVEKLGGMIALLRFKY